MGFYLNKINLYLKKMRFALFTLFLAFVFVAQTSAFKCPLAEINAVRDCFKQDADCKVACVQCAAENCADKEGKPKAECVLENCPKRCMCKKNCFKICINM